mgnify:CR=1 FL=1
MAGKEGANLATRNDGRVNVQIRPALRHSIDHVVVRLPDGPATGVRNGRL